MMPRLRSALSGILLALATASALQAQVPQGPKVSAVNFVGNRTFDDATLATAIATNSGQCKVLAVLCAIGIGKEPYYFDEPTLRADVVRLRIFYYEHGFHEATVSADTAAAGKNVRVTFHIGEGRPVRVSGITVTGLDVPGARDVTRNLQLREGDRFDVLLYDAARDTIIARLKDRGYPRAEVLAGYDIRNAEPYAASVRYNVMPGTRARFGTIDVVGNRAVSGRVVKRMLSFGPGDLYDQADILQSQRNLFQLQLFRHVDISPNLDATPDSVVPVTVQVNEGDTHSVRVGAGMNEAECVTTEGRWQSQNFMGGARQLQVRARISNLFATNITGPPCDQVGDSIYRALTHQVTIDFVQPFIFGPANNAGAGFVWERRSLSNIFVRTAVGGYVSLTRRLGPSASISLAYRPERTRLIADEVFLCTGFVGCAYNELSILQDPNWLAPVTLTYFVDRSNDIFFPTRGHVLRTDLEYATSFTGSRFAYARWSVDASFYHGTGPTVLAMHVRAGAARDLGSDGELGLSPQKRFFAGGANSVRGFRQFALGPEVLTVDAVRYLLPDTVPSEGLPGAGCSALSVNNGTCDASGLHSGQFQARPVGGEAVLEGSIELRLPSPLWGDKLRTAVFVDAGQVWSTAAKVKLSQIIATPGFGVRYQSPVGPIRLDIAYNTQRASDHDVLTTKVCLVETNSMTCPGSEAEIGHYRNTDNLQRLDSPVRWSPYSRPADTLQGFLQRLRIHFSIGQAF